MRNVFAFVVAVLFLAVFVGALWGGRTSAEAVPAAAGPGDALWNVRTLDVLVQGALLLAGVLGILALVAERREKGGGA